MVNVIHAKPRLVSFETNLNGSNFQLFVFNVRMRLASQPVPKTPSQRRKESQHATMIAVLAAGYVQWFVPSLP
jgi:hypothetical protein